MKTTKAKTVTTLGTTLLLAAGLVAIGGWKRAQAAPSGKTEVDKIAESAAHIQQSNADLPDLQVQAKTLIFATMIQKRIPPAAKWCDTLNTGGKLWPVTPTNTVFALNAQVAGRPFSKTNMPPGDVVVYFEAAGAGWNQAGGAELLANKPTGVAVALADGRALLVTPAEAVHLRWTP